MSEFASSTFTVVLINIALTTAPLFIIVGLVIFRTWMAKRHYNTQFLDLVIKGAGAAYGYLVKNNQRITNGTAVVSAIEFGLETVMQAPNIEAKMEALGVTPAYAKKLINAELGRLVATDPTVNVGPTTDKPSPAPALAVAIAPSGGAVDAKGEISEIKEAVVDALKDKV